MPDDEHSVILAELNEFVCQAKVISVFFRVYHFTLHAVFGHNGVEVAAHYIDCAGVAPRSLFEVMATPTRNLSPRMFVRVGSAATGLSLLQDINASGTN